MVTVITVIETFEKHPFLLNFGVRLKFWHAVKRQRYPQGTQFIPEACPVN